MSKTRPKRTEHSVQLEQLSDALGYPKRKSKADPCSIKDCPNEIFDYSINVCWDHLSKEKKERWNAEVTELAKEVKEESDVEQS